MKYRQVVKGTFIDRPNRFIANVGIDGKDDVPGQISKCHVKNTGRCKEILLPGTEVILSVSDSPHRSTKYDLIAARKNGRLINIDSQAPNTVVKESFSSICEHDLLIPEYTYGDSRFDFYAEYNGKPIFVEVKGVTKENDDVVCFPDAPTERGLKHVHELTELARSGMECYIVLVVQMENVKYFIPDYEIHLEFGLALQSAAKAGVHVLAFDCIVTEDSMTLNRPVKVRY